MVKQPKMNPRMVGNEKSDVVIFSKGGLFKRGIILRQTKDG
jgi:hypothetical protein